MDDGKYFGAIEGDYVDSWSYTITKAEGWVKENLMVQSLYVKEILIFRSI
jgi:hypothetical protein